MSLPPYDEVRDETNAVLQQIVDKVPGAVDLIHPPEGEPYPCGDSFSLGGGPKDGAFYTGHWGVKLTPGSDAVAIRRALPATLGPGWRELPVPTSVADGVTSVLNEATGRSVDIKSGALDGQPILDLLSNSRCGKKPEYSTGTK